MVKRSSSPESGSEEGTSQSDDRNYVDFGDDDESEAAVERWLTSPVTTSGTSTFFGGKFSHHGGLGHQISSPRSDARTSASAPVALSPGKVILRERLRQRAQRKQRKGSFGGKEKRKNSSRSHVLELVKRRDPTLDRLETLLRKASPRSSEGATTPTTATTISTSSFGTRSSMAELLKACEDLEDELATTLTESDAGGFDSPLGMEHCDKLINESSSEDSRDHRHKPLVQTKAGSGLSAGSVSDTKCIPSTGKLSLPESPERPQETSSSRTLSTSSSTVSSPLGSRSQICSAESSEAVSPRRNTSDDVSDCQQTAMSIGSSEAVSPSKKRFFGSDVQSSSNSTVTTLDTQQTHSDKRSSDEPSKRVPDPLGKRLSLREVKSYSPSHRKTRATRTRNEPPETRELYDAASEKSMREIIQDKRQSPGRSKVIQCNRIRLHIYDLIASETVVSLPWGFNFPIGQCFSVVNSSLHSLGTGAYHVGIEINGIEYAYGANDSRGITGVFTCMPRRSPGYQFRQTIDFGPRSVVRTAYVNKEGNEIQYPPKATSTSKTTTMTTNPPPREGYRMIRRHVDGREIVREMAQEYMGVDYDLLRKNCCTFAHDACTRLGIREEEVPSWFRNLCHAGAMTQDAAELTMKPLSKVLSVCDCDVIDGNMPDYVSEKGFEIRAGKDSSKKAQVLNAENGEDGDDTHSLKSADPVERATTWNY